MQVSRLTWCVSNFSLGLDGSTNLHIKVTFGSPRVGNPTTAAFITAQTNGATYRITHLNDPVPRLPPADFGFQHVEPEYYISSANDVAVTVSDIQTCDCNENWVALDINAHGWYFAEIGACYPGGLFEVK
jgi:hypothetical protein